MSTSGRTPVTCPVCGADIHPKDRYCAACGADVVANGAGSDSLMDELMPGGEQRWEDTPVAGHPAVGAGYGDREDGDRGYGDAEYGDPSYAAPEVAGERWDGGYADPAEDGRYAAPAAYPDVPPAPRDEEPRRGSLVLPVVVLVAVLVVAVLAWRLVFSGGGDDTDVAAGPTTSSESSQTPTDGAESPSEAEPSESASQDEGPEEVVLASTAKRCGSGGGGTVYRGNEVTSCEFAVEVAKALGDEADLPAKVTARSPVTKREYTMTCENTAPVTCRGGNQALVYVDRG